MEYGTLCMSLRRVPCSTSLARADETCVERQREEKGREHFPCQPKSVCKGKATLRKSARGAGAGAARPEERLALRSAIFDAQHRFDLLDVIGIQLEAVFPLALVDRLGEDLQEALAGRILVDLAIVEAAAAAEANEVCLHRLRLRPLAVDHRPRRR